MDTSRWKQIQDLFEEALEKPLDARKSFLLEECGDDTELLNEVCSLLEADGSTHNIFEAAMEGVLDAAAAALSQHGRIIGQYKIVQELGAGGMGTVYLAERADGHFEHQVALKIIRLEVSSGDALMRFQSERQILAHLQHPNIARLLDGGVSEDGLPYFTMDYVDGLPIDEYCDEEKLSIGDRLRLFREICAAVQYAHGNLVVHRDLKPSNILVTKEGVVKLLDFGIAKLLVDQESGDAMMTRVGQRVMTPEYASPEQVKGETIGTASDVYSLGVILYQLLTGCRPYRFPTRSPSDMERVITMEEPKRPSSAVFSVDENAEQETPERRSALRGTQVDRLRKRLAGDLDNICLMALRKEPSRRYGSAEQLLADIDRHLKGLPISARPATVSYRMEKFVLRHRVSVVAALVVLLGIAGIITFYTVQLREERDRAMVEAEKAAQVSQFLTGFFEIADPYNAQGRSVTAREMLDKGALRIEEELESQPEVQATLYYVVGDVYLSLGLFEQSEKYLSKSLEIRRELLRREDPEVGATLNKLGEMYTQSARYDLAKSFLHDALTIRLAKNSDNGGKVAETLNNTGWLLNVLGELDSAEAYYNNALTLWIEAGPTHRAEASTCMNNLALLLDEKGNKAAAESLYRKALAIQVELYHGPHPETGTTIYNLSQLLLFSGRYAEAESLQRAGLAMDKELFGEEHPNVAYSLNSLAQLLERKGQMAEAEKYFCDVLAMRLRLLGPDHPDVGYSYYHLGRLLHKEKRYGEAEAMYRDALRIHRAALGEDHSATARSLNGLGTLYRDQNDFPHAISLYRQALAVSRDKLPADHPSITSSLLTLGETLVDAGRAGEAEPYLREALSREESTRPAGDYRILVAQSALGGCLTSLKKFTEAEGLLLQSSEGLRKLKGDANVMTIKSAQRLHHLHEKWTNGAIKSGQSPHGGSSSLKNVQ